jgi:Na+(H+)/acetate symporter ActP
MMKKATCFDLHDLNFFIMRTDEAERNGGGGCVSLFNTDELYQNDFLSDHQITQSLLNDDRSVARSLFLFSINASIANLPHINFRFHVVASVEKNAMAANFPN